MNQDQLRELIRTGLPALKAGVRLAAADALEVSRSATDPALKSPGGNDLAKTWAARVDRSMREAGASGEGDNPILGAHLRTAKRIREAAPDDPTRDLGIIAAGQLAMHYWIAAFGSVAAYAQQAGLDQTAQERGRSRTGGPRADPACRPVHELAL